MHESTRARKAATVEAPTLQVSPGLRLRPGSRPGVRRHGPGLALWSDTRGMKTAVSVPLPQDIAHPGACGKTRVDPHRRRGSCGEAAARRRSLEKQRRRIRGSAITRPPAEDGSALTPRREDSFAV